MPAQGLQNPVFQGCRWTCQYAERKSSDRPMILAKWRKKSGFDGQCSAGVGLVKVLFCSVSTAHTFDLTGNV